MIPVAANDVAFSTHAVLVTAIILFQILIYDVRGLILFLTEFISSFIWRGSFWLNLTLPWWFSTAWKSEGFQGSYCDCLCCVVICCCLFFHSFTKPFLALANLHFQVRYVLFMVLYLQFQPYVNGNNASQLISYLHRMTINWTKFLFWW